MYPVPKLMNLAPNERRNGTTKTFMKGVKCLKEEILPLSFVAHGECITMQNGVHKQELWRLLGLAASIAVLVRKLPLTHVHNDFCNVELGRLLLKLGFIMRVLIIAVESSGYVSCGHLNILALNYQGHDEYPMFQQFYKQQSIQFCHITRLKWKYFTLKSELYE